MALNMIDVVRKNGDTIDIKKLGDALGCEVIETSALKGIGSKEVAEKAIELARSKMPYSVPHIFSESLEKALAQIENIVRENINKVNSRWISIKLFERDEKILEQIELRDDLKERIENIISSCEKKFDDDSESIVTNERYAYINKLIKQELYRKNKARVNMSDRIDKIVTNRILALPIFVAIMFLVYYFSI